MFERFALCFDRAASLDYALRDLDIGFSFDDLITEFNAEVKCSLNITDLLDSKRINISSDFSCRCSFVVGCARGLLVKIMNELLLQKEEAAKTSSSVMEESSKRQSNYAERTAVTHPKDPFYGVVKVGVDNKKVTKTGRQMEAQRIEGERKRKNMWR